MGTRGMLVCLVVLTAAAAAAAAAAEQGPIAKPGCQDKCGNVSIPYPFGTSEKCYYDENFLITCNDTYDPPLAFLTASPINVTKISLEGKLTGINIVGTNCYNESGAPDVAANKSPYLNLVKFIMSDSDNRFVAIGCDTEAYIQGIQAEGDKGYTTGCITKCDSLDYVANFTCSGIGCCQTSVAKGVRYFNVTVKSYKNHTGVWSFNPCSYAFVVEAAQFNFSSRLLRDLQNVSTLPVVFDWSIGNDTCETVEGKKMHNACHGNSTCYNVDNGSGYRCKCLEGFDGNPYLPDGCQDIDECEDSNLNNCEKKCINTVGSYRCSCPKGHRGDGRRDGTGCVARQSVVIIVTLGIGIVLGCFLLLFVRWLYKGLKRRKDTKLKEKFFKRNGGMLLQNKLSSGEGSIEKTKLFTSKELEFATDRYNENRILGRGGQGTVYKGILPDGRIVAVKKSKIIDEGQLEQFINEVFILSQIDHRNVVKLLGCCLEAEIPLLVYEFVPNGTLYQFIHDQSREFPNSWEMRLRIAAEVASAICYLHSAASVPIYHRDIKSTNILLDVKFRAKISDFGTSKSIDIDQTHLTTQVKGTFGYLDPEYFQSSQFTEKSDVYSFGVVLVELLTGQRPISSFGSQEKRGLVAYFMSSLEGNCFLDVLDAQVVKDGGKEELMAVGKLAERCLDMSGRNRPTMKEALMELERVRMLQGYAVAKPKQDEGLLTEPGENWDFISSPVTECLDCSTAASSDIQSLMFNTS